MGLKTPKKSLKTLNWTLFIQNRLILFFMKWSSKKSMKPIWNRKKRLNRLICFIFLRNQNYTKNYFQKQNLEHSHQNSFAIICILPSSTRVFLLLEHYINYFFISKVNIRGNFIGICLWYI